MKFRSLLKVSNLLKILSLIIFLGLSYTIFGQVDDPRVDGIPPGMYDNLPPTIQSPMAPVTVGDYDNFNIGTDFSECHISANPNNPLQFFCAYNINGPHYTQNGYDWASTVPSFGSTPRGDPTTAYDGAGNLYYENMYGSISGTKIIKSTNNGQTWQSWVYGNTGRDKNWMAAVQTGGPYANYIYTIMTNSSFSGANFKRSTNLGASFGGSLTFSYSPLPGAMVCVGPNGSTNGGTVFAVGNSGSAFASTYIFYKSTNGGASFTMMSAQNFSGYLGTAVGGRNSIQGMRLRPYPFITADNSNGPHRGRLYLVYATNNPPGNGTINIPIQNSIIRIPRRIQGVPIQMQKQYLLLIYNRSRIIQLPHFTFRKSLIKNNHIINYPIKTSIANRKRISSNVSINRTIC